MPCTRRRRRATSEHRDDRRDAEAAARGDGRDDQPDPGEHERVQERTAERPQVVRVPVAQRQLGQQRADVQDHQRQRHQDEQRRRERRVLGQHVVDPLQRPGQVERDRPGTAGRARPPAGACAGDEDRSPRAAGSSTYARVVARQLVRGRHGGDHGHDQRREAASRRAAASASPWTGRPAQPVGALRRLSTNRARAMVAAAQPGRRRSGGSRGRGSLPGRAGRRQRAAQRASTCCTPVGRRGRREDLGHPVPAAFHPHQPHARAGRRRRAPRRTSCRRAGRPRAAGRRSRTEAGLSEPAGGQVVGALGHLDGDQRAGVR